MECDREEESGEMYSPNECGEYMPHGDAPNFTVQGLCDALTEAESTVTEPPPLAEEFVIQLDVTMGDRNGKAVTTSIFMEWRFGVACLEK